MIITPIVSKTPIPIPRTTTHKPKSPGKASTGLATHFLIFGTIVIKPVPIPAKIAVANQIAQ